MNYLRSLNLLINQCPPPSRWNGQPYLISSLLVPDVQGKYRYQRWQQIIMLNPKGLAIILQCERDLYKKFGFYSEI